MTRSAPIRALLLLLACSAAAVGQVRREIVFPNVPGYVTLACDFHTHTVFSDGQVWPPVRVVEAWRQGLDVVALTDHIEYQPHRDDVPTNFNRPYELARGAAAQRNLVLIRGAEITRDTPPGHFNALFLKDIDPLDTPDFVEAVKRANQQGGFVFWNHQAWKGEERGRWLDVHTVLYQNGWLHGMEVANGETYFPQAHRWCLEKKLAMLGNSDIHEPDVLEENRSERHRTLTLVLAKYRTVEGVEEALRAGRTVVWWNEQLIGREAWLAPLVRQSVLLRPAHLRTKDTVWVEVENACPADLELERRGELGPEQLVLPARSVSLLRINGAPAEGPVRLQYAVRNCLVAPETPLSLTLVAGD